MTTDNPSGFAEQLHQKLDRAGLTEEAGDRKSSERFGTALRALQDELERDGFDSKRRPRECRSLFCGWY